MRASRQDHERRRLGGRGLRALVGVPGGAGGVDGKIVALAALVGLDGEQGAGESGPGRRVVGVEHDGLRHRRARRRGSVPAASRRSPPALSSAAIALGLPVGLEIGLVALGVGLHAGVGEAHLLGPLLGVGKRYDGEADEEGGEHTESE